MAACASCLKSVCDCKKNDNEPYNGELMSQPCAFAFGLHKNVTVEIGYDCKVISMRPADIEEVFLCDPCPAGIEDDNTEPVAGYDQGYADAKAIYYDIGYNTGYTKGREVGIDIGKSEGYSSGLTEGDSAGYDRGFADGRADVDCDVEFTRGYDQGFEEGKGLAPTDINDVLDSLSEESPTYVTYNSKNTGRVTATISVNSSGKWASDDSNVSVNEQTGEITIGSDISDTPNIVISKQKPTSDNDDNDDPQEDITPTYPDYTGLGMSDEYNRLINASTTLVSDINAIKANGWTFQHNYDSDGSFAETSSKEIFVGNRSSEDHQAFFNTVAHEVAHAQYTGPIDYSSRDAYIDSWLTNEGHSQIYNIKVADEAEAKLGVTIGWTYLNRFLPAYEQYGFTEQAFYDAGQIVGDEFTTSTTGENYRVYYGNFYDENYA